MLNSAEHEWYMMNNDVWTRKFIMYKQEINTNLWTWAMKYISLVYLIFQLFYVYFLHYCKMLTQLSLTLSLSLSLLSNSFFLSKCLTLLALPFFRFSLSLSLSSHFRPIFSLS